MFKPINSEKPAKLLLRPGLQYWFKERRTLTDFRRGPLGSHFDGFARYLEAKGYSKHWGGEILGKCCQFNAFLIDQGITPTARRFFHRLGEILDRTFENQRYRASGLNLAVAAMILWNTIYIGRAVTELRSHREIISDDLLAHVAPLDWEHITFNGDYISPTEPLQHGFRPLRNPAQRSWMPLGRKSLLTFEVIFTKAEERQCRLLTSRLRLSSIRR